MKQVNRRHRKPSSLGGTSEPRTILRPPVKKHAAWHILFRTLAAERIAEEPRRDECTGLTD